MERARGEYVARQDFDDRSYPDRLRLQVALLDARPQVGIVGGAYLLVDERRGERYVRMPPTDHAALRAAMARYVPIAHTVATFRRQAWVDGAAAALQQGDEGAYVNFLGDEGPERVRQAYPGPTWDRLVQVKRRYDPDNLFRRNHNIPPA